MVNLIQFGLILVDFFEPNVEFIGKNHCFKFHACTKKLQKSFCLKPTWFRSLLSILKWLEFKSLQFHSFSTYWPSKIRNKVAFFNYILIHGIIRIIRTNVSEPGSCYLCSSPLLLIIQPNNLFWFSALLIIFFFFCFCFCFWVMQDKHCGSPCASTIPVKSRILPGRNSKHHQYGLHRGSASTTW